MSNEITKKACLHNIILENREKLMLSGVEDVICFDEMELELITNLGELTVRGEMLNIENLNRDTGEMLITGKINELMYSDKKPETKGFFRKMFS